MQGSFAACSLIFMHLFPYWSWDGKSIQACLTLGQKGGWEYRFLQICRLKTNCRILHRPRNLLDFDSPLESHYVGLGTALRQHQAYKNMTIPQNHSLHFVVNLEHLTYIMCDDAEVLARGCGHLYDLEIRRCPNAIQNNTTCAVRTRVRYPQEDHDGKCKSCEGQSPPDSTW